MSFNESLILLLIDKGVLVAVVGFVGWFAKLALQRYESRQALAVEIAKVRLKDVDAIWSAAAEVSDARLKLESLLTKRLAWAAGLQLPEMRAGTSFYNALFQMAYQIPELRLSAEADPEPLEVAQDQLLRAVADLHSTLRNYRHWLPVQFIESAGSYMDHVRAVASIRQGSVDTRALVKKLRLINFLEGTLVRRVGSLSTVG